MIRVVVADDHTMVREAIVWILVHSKKIDVVGQAATGAAALALTKLRRPDVLVLDLTMPEKDGLQVLAELAEARHLRTKVLVLTMHDDEAHGVRALEAGAAAFLPKSVPMQELVASIERAHRGEKVASRALLDALARPARARAPYRLSPREFQVLTHLAAGKNHHEIADELSINVKTVDTHRYHILRKLRLRNNADLTRFAIAEGLLPV